MKRMEAEHIMDMIKVEHDVDVLGKGSSIDMKNVQSAWVVPLKEEEPVVTYVNCTDPLKVEPDSYIEANTYSNDGTDIIDIKVELSDIKKDEYTVPVRSAGINAEQENCRHPLEVESDSHIAYASSSRNGFGVIDIKVEVSYIGENEYAMPTTFSEISAKEEKHTQRHPVIPSVDHPYSCDVCNKVFTGQSNLHEHQGRRSAQHPYLCDVCDKSFSRLSSLNQHILRHPGKQFCCDMCNKLFHAQSYLNTHEQIHSRERPHSCIVCNKSFSVRSNLISHQRLHSGEWLYVCDVCRKSFRHLNTLKEHESSHTGTCQHSCDLCKKSFCRLSTLFHYKCTHIGEKLHSCISVYGLLHVSAFVKSHHKAVKKYVKKDNLNQTH